MTKRIYGSKRSKKNEGENEPKEIQPQATNELVDALERAGEAISARPAKAAGNAARRRGYQTEVVCEMTIWRRAWRMFGLTLVVILSISFIATRSTMVGASWQLIALTLFVLVFFNATILFPNLAEVWYVNANPEGIELRALLWRSRLPWSGVLEFRNPSYLRIALLKINRGFYLVNKHALPNYEILEQIIVDHVPPRKNR